MAVGDKWIEEFTYRGRPPGNTQPSGWHLVIGEIVDAFGAEKPIVSHTMTMAQAKALGWDLPQIVASINGQALAEIEDLRAEKERLTNERDVAVEKANALEAALKRGVDTPPLARLPV